MERAANAFRAWRPVELQDPMVSVSIFSVVTLTRAGTFEDLPQALEFISRLLKAFLLGFAIAIGISLLILPITCRGNVFKDIQSYTEQAQAVLGSLIDFLQSTSRDTEIADTEQTPSLSEAIQARSKLSATISRLNALDAKIQSSLCYAKIELAWGKLAASDLDDISDLLRNLLRPLSGLSLLPDILDSFAEPDSIATYVPQSCPDGAKERGPKYVVDVFSTNLSKTRSLMAVGLQYFLEQLELVDQRQACNKEYALELLDQDGKPINLDPKSDDFIDEFERSLKHLSSQKQVLGRIFNSRNSIRHIEESGDGPGTREGGPGLEYQYFLALYLFYLQDMVGDATLALALFARRKVADDTMARHRLIRPNKLNPRAWFSPSSQSNEDSTVFNDFKQPPEETNGIKVADPEHLLPSNIWERGSRSLRTVLTLIGSDLSMFGLRVSVASFCVGILAFLHQTQEFFIHQRCVWAMIVIVIGMSPTSGQSLFGFVSRILVTAVAVVLSLIAWYIVDGKTPGVIIFLYLANMVGVSRSTQYSAMDQEAHGLTVLRLR